MIHPTQFRLSREAMANMTDEQRKAAVGLAERFLADECHLMRGGLGLPDHYLSGRLDYAVGDSRDRQKRTYYFGIDREGSVSS